MAVRRPNLQLMELHEAELRNTMVLAILIFVRRGAITNSVRIVCDDAITQMKIELIENRSVAVRDKQCFAQNTIDTIKTAFITCGRAILDDLGKDFYDICGMPPIHFGKPELTTHMQILALADWNRRSMRFACCVNNHNCHTCGEYERVKKEFCMMTMFRN